MFLCNGEQQSRDKTRNGRFFSRKHLTQEGDTKGQRGAGGIECGKYATHPTDRHDRSRMTLHFWLGRMYFRSERYFLYSSALINFGWQRAGTSLAAFAAIIGSGRCQSCPRPLPTQKARCFSPLPHRLFPICDGQNSLKRHSKKHGEEGAIGERSDGGA